MTIDRASLSPEIQQLAETVAAKFATLPSVVAIALAGSQGAVASDEQSDLDIYIYADAEIPVEARSQIAREFAQRLEINNQFWETGDEWVDLQTGRSLDIMYRSPDWIEAQLAAVLDRYQASVGYSTCFWWNVLKSRCLYDRKGWFQQLQSKANRPYPAALTQAILAKNYPILRRNLSSYLHQLELAIQREDWVSINHRTTAILASYFDILFAVNGVPHPGEKRLVKLATHLCSKRPPQMAEQVKSLVTADVSNWRDRVNQLIDGLDELLVTEGFIFNSSQLENP